MTASVAARDSCEPSRNNWIAVVGAGLIGAVGLFDLTAVNVVLPGLSRYFAVTPAAIQWVVLSYLLPITSLALPIGRWLDQVGRRPALIVLLSGFAVATAGVAMAPSFAVLICMRVLEGMFGAGLFALTSVVAFESVRPAKRNISIAIMSTVSPIGGISGPSFGALVAQAMGWRAIFLFSAIVMGGLAILLPLVVQGRGALRWPSIGMLVETALLSTAVVSVLIAFTFATNPQNIYWLALSFVALPSAMTWKRSFRNSTLIELLRLPGMGWSFTSIGLLSGCSIAAQYLVAFFAEDVLHMSIGETGLAILAVAAFTLLFAQPAGMLSTLVGRPIVAMLGFALIAVSVFSLLFLSTSSTFLSVAARMALLGVGSGLVSGPTSVIALVKAPSGLIGSAGSSSSFFRNIGFTLGPSIVTMIWAFGNYRMSGMRAGFAVVGCLALVGIVSVVLSRDRLRT